MRCTFNERVMARIWATTSRSKRNEEVEGFILTATTPRAFDAWTWLDEELKEVLSDLVQDMSLRGAQRKKAPAFDGAPPPSKPVVVEEVKAPPPPPPPQTQAEPGMKLHYEGVELCLRQTGAAATGQGPLTLEFGGLRVTVERSDGVSTIAGGRVDRRHATVQGRRGGAKPDSRSTSPETVQDRPCAGRRLQ